MGSVLSDKPYVWGIFVGVEVVIMSEFRGLVGMEGEYSGRTDGTSRG